MNYADHPPGATPSSESGDQERGVLLYYKYVDLDDRREYVEALFKKSCGELNLRGRVRVAKDGVNATLGGSIECLEKHVDDVKNDPVLAGTDIDFKLAKSEGPRNEQTTLESGFDRLSINLVEEVVTLGPRAVSRANPNANAGLHLTPEEFHDRLLHRDNSSASGVDGRGAAARPVVLLDTRNVYETRIGRFDVPGVTTLTPQLRCFSDLPAWVDRHENELRDKQVIMYCTGGVRCERASAYLRDKGRGFDNVVQLKGGIQRYLEAFPHGGLFEGKNFVFDERGAVTGSSETVGRCLLCSSPWDDYGHRDRCPACRLLILVCNTCRREGLLTASVKCELCIEAGHSGGGAAGGEHRKLRILCLHGFRQTGKSFQGRTNALRKKLKVLAEFVFIDAPHELAFVVKHPPEVHLEGDAPTPSPPDMEDSRIPHGDSDTGLGQSSRNNTYPGNRMDDIRVQEVMPIGSSRLGLADRAPVDTAATRASELHPHRSRRAWLVAPPAADRLSAPHFDDTQYTTQIHGWEASLEKIELAFAEQGPFDGVMGFSQGASVVGTLCALKQAGAIADDSFRFAILASGYVSCVKEHRALMEFQGRILVPSLHIFGSAASGEDKQISRELSEELLHCFDRQVARCVRHNQGHIIPCAKTYIAEYASFLSQFL